MKSKNTKVCGLIGNPVEHSVSPAMHNAAFKKLGLDYTYLPIKVERDSLPKAIEGFKALDIRGFNVTIPYKVSVIPLLDELEPMAEKIGAINTVVNDKGHLKGYNTDAGGFLKALLEKGIKVKGKRAVVLGAGGASRAISFVLAEEGAEIIILNRKREIDWAVDLSTSIYRFTGKHVEALVLNDENLSSVLVAADILVNATSVGMSPNSNNSPLPARLLKPELVVFDVVYNPLKTRLLAEAEAAGAETKKMLDLHSLMMFTSHFFAHLAQ